MAKSKTSFKPGQSGNPAGRPPNEAALRNILRDASLTTVSYNNERMARRQVIAEILWVAATTGRLSFDGRNDILTASDYLNLVKFLVTTIDPVRSEVDVTTGGDAINSISLIEVVRPPESE